MSPDQLFFIFDGESLGVHGTTFAVAAGIYDIRGRELQHVSMHVDVTSEMAKGVPQMDIRWVRENVTVNGDSQKCESLHAFRMNFMNLWRSAKAEHPGILMAAECNWPVEARFLIECVEECPTEFRFEGPYPFIDIASVMLAAGMDPMATYPRLADEEPAHEPLADTRQSARLLAEAIARCPNMILPAGLPS